MNHTQYTGSSSAKRYLTYDDVCFRGYQDYRTGDWTEEYEMADEHWQRRYEAGRHLSAAHENWCKKDKHSIIYWTSLKNVPRRLTALIYNFAQHGYFK